MDPTMLDIGMIITDRALIDPGAGDIAQIEGYGPVPVDCVREDLRAALREPADLQDGPIGPDGPDLRAVLRRLYTHPTTGELVAVESKARAFPKAMRSEEHTSELQSRGHLVCRLLLEKKKQHNATRQRQ